VAERLDGLQPLRELLSCDLAALHPYVLDRAEGRGVRGEKADGARRTVLGQTSERQRDQTLATYETFNQDCLMFCGIQALTGCGWM